MDGEAFVVFGSKAGAPTNPDWYHNLRANPKASVEVGSYHYDVTARVAEGEEHDRFWAKQKKDMPNFAGYEDKTDRKITVIVLEVASSAPPLSRRHLRGSRGRYSRRHEQAPWRQSCGAGPPREVYVERARARVPCGCRRPARRGDAVARSCAHVWLETTRPPPGRSTVGSSSRGS